MSYLPNPEKEQAETPLKHSSLYQDLRWSCIVQVGARVQGDRLHFTCVEVSLHLFSLHLYESTLELDGFPSLLTLMTSLAFSLARCFLGNL